MKKYTRLFIDESRVYIPGMAGILGRLSAGRPREFDVRDGQRLAHSIKGMALYEEQTDIAVLTWAMERGFEKLLGNGPHNPLVVNLASAVSVLARMIDEVGEHGATRADPGDIVAALEAAMCREAS